MHGCIFELSGDWRPAGVRWKREKDSVRGPAPFQMTSEPHSQIKVYWSSAQDTEKPYRSEPDVTTRPFSN